MKIEGKNLAVMSDNIAAAYLNISRGAVELNDNYPADGDSVASHLECAVAHLQAAIDLARAA
jgi:hypothetical protein